CLEGSCSGESKPLRRRAWIENRTGRKLLCAAGRKVPSPNRGSVPRRGSGPRQKEGGAVVGSASLPHLLIARLVSVRQSRAAVPPHHQPPALDLHDRRLTPGLRNQKGGQGAFGDGVADGLLTDPEQARRLFDREPVISRERLPLL